MTPKGPDGKAWRLRWPICAQILSAALAYLRGKSRDGVTGPQTLSVHGEPDVTACGPGIPKPDIAQGFEGTGTARHTSGENLKFRPMRGKDRRRVGIRRLPIKIKESRLRDLLTVG